MAKKITSEEKAKIRRMMDARRRQLRAPVNRSYPHYYPGMTAADYIRRYNAMNGHAYQDRCTLEFITETIVSESRTYDPLTPLCFEETLE